MFSERWDASVQLTLGLTQLYVKRVAVDARSQIVESTGDVVGVRPGVVRVIRASFPLSAARPGPVSPWPNPWLPRKFWAIIVPRTVPAMLPRRLPAIISPPPGRATGNAAEHPSRYARLADVVARSEARERLWIVCRPGTIRLGHFGEPLLEGRVG